MKNIKNNEILKILKEIENKNSIIFDSLVKLPESELEDNYELLKKYVENELIGTTINIYDGSIYETIIKQENDKNPKETQNIENKYLIKLQNKELYKYDLTKDIEISNNRKEFLSYLKSILKEKNDNEIRNVWLSSKSGSGKTKIVISFSNSLAKLDNKVIYISINDLLREVNLALFKKRNDIINDYFEKMKLVDYLFIDDIGHENLSDWFKINFLVPLIEFRNNFNSKKQTFFISVFNIDEYKRKFYFNEKNINDKLFNKIESNLKKISF